MNFDRRQVLSLAALSTAVAALPVRGHAAVPLVGVDWGGPLIEAVKGLAAQYKDVDITWDLHAGGAATTMPKIKAAWPNPRYDFLAVFSLNYITMINEGWLEPITYENMPNLKDVPEQLHIKDKSGAMVAAPRSIAGYFWGYRADTSPVKIERIEQLLDPKLKGQICWPGPMINGNTQLLSLALANGGDEKNLEPGWEFLTKLAKSGNIARVANTETDFINAMTTGETSVGFWNIAPWAKISANFPTTVLTRAEKDRGLKAYIYQDGWVVLKSSKNKKAAFDFINFCLSPENNQAFNLKTGQVPTNNKSKVGGFGQVISFHNDEIEKFAYFPNYEVLSNQLSDIGKRFEAQIVPLL
jgi:putative spermidine/putrescine transport system substrate-binding protein